MTKEQEIQKLSEELVNYLNQIHDDISDNKEIKHAARFQVKSEINLVIKNKSKIFKLIKILNDYLNKDLAAKYISEINKIIKAPPSSIIDNSSLDRTKTESIIPNYSPHPSAELMPLMNDDEFLRLKEDIKVRGQDDFIYIFNGQIVDGRHRYRACLELGIQPKIKQLINDDSFVDFVVAKNIHRRELTSSQRAAIGVNLLPEYEERARERQKTSTGGPQPQLKEFFLEAKEKGKASTIAAKVVGSNEKYIEFLKDIKEKYPALFKQVFNGEKTISQIKKLLHPKEIKADKASIPKLSGIPESIIIEMIELITPSFEKLQCWEKNCTGKSRKFFREYLTSKYQEVA